MKSNISASRAIFAGRFVLSLQPLRDLDDWKVESRERVFENGPMGSRSGRPRALSSFSLFSLSQDVDGRRYRWDCSATDRSFYRGPVWWVERAGLPRTDRGRGPPTHPSSYDLHSLLIFGVLCFALRAPERAIAFSRALTCSLYSGVSYTRPLCPAYTPGYAAKASSGRFSRCDSRKDTSFSRVDSGARPA